MTLMTSLLYCLRLLPLLFLLTATLTSGSSRNDTVVGNPGSATGEVVEYCEGQTFAARCSAHDEVIVMQSAYYGRMRLGRCLVVNLGNLGCQLDVLPQFDSMCSGQRRCDVRVSSIIDSLPAGNSFPCIRDFRGYLEASYRCMKVVSVRKDDCIPSTAVEVFALPSAPVVTQHLASVVTEETGCGSLDTPWILHAPPGQKLRLHLIDFETASRTAARIASGSVGQVPHVCQVYAVIKEKSSIRSGGGETVCGSESRESHVYTSLTNVVEIRVVTARKNHKTDHFLIRYDVIGCPDAIASSGDGPHWIDRSGDMAVVGCNGTLDSWQLRCEGDQWVGPRRNCTPLTSADQYHGFSATVWSVFTGTQWAAILIILAMAVAVGMVIFCVGLIYIKRRRSRDAAQSRRPAYLDSSGRIVGSLCGSGDYHIGMHCAVDHHHHINAGTGIVSHHSSPPTGLLLTSKTSMSNATTASLTGIPIDGTGNGGTAACSPAGSATSPGGTIASDGAGPYTAENDYFRTWQLLRHAACKRGASTVVVPPRGVRPVPHPSAMVCGNSGSADLLLDSCMSNGASRSPPEHIYESPKFERRDFFPTSSLSASAAQMMQQTASQQSSDFGPAQHHCVCCSTTFASPVTSLNAQAQQLAGNRSACCGRQSCGASAVQMEYCDLDVNALPPPRV